MFVSNVSRFRFECLEAKCENYSMECMLSCDLPEIGLVFVIMEMANVNYEMSGNACG